MITKHVEAYCSDCQIRNRYALNSKLHIRRLAITCKLCDRKLKVKRCSESAPPVSGFLLGRLASAV